MKIDFTLILLFLAGFLSAQTEPIEKVEFDPDPVFMDSYDYATGLMNDVPWMFKATLDEQIRIGFEYKVQEAISLNLSSALSIGLSSVFNANNRLSARYYFQHNEKIAQGRQGNNLNGRYFELGSRFNINTTTGVSLNPIARLGFQSRFLKYGLIDTGLDFEYSPRARSLTITSGFAIGLAFSKSYELQQVDDNRCAVLRCYDEQAAMFKTQLSRLMSMRITANSFQFQLEPNFEFEHRISRVSLTMNHELWTNLTGNFASNNTSSLIGEVGLRSSIRWYIGKKRRIIKGKTSNNLSGFYVGPIGEIGVVGGEKFNSAIEDGQFWSAGYNIGYQTRLLRNLYIHFSTGAMYREYYNNDDYAVFQDISSETQTVIISQPVIIDAFTDPPARFLDRTIGFKIIGKLVVGYTF